MSLGRRRTTVSGALVLAAALAGCSASADQAPLDAVLPEADRPSPSTTEATPPPPPRLRVNVAQGKPVGVDTQVKVGAVHGTLDSVRVTGDGASLPGEMGDRGWTATERLEPGTTYQVSGVVRTHDGQTKQLAREFRTVDLTLDQQTYASIAPVQDETVGVGMPVIVTFDLPVTDRAEVERHLAVDASPAQPGSWHWISDNEVHYRPRSYWEPGTAVTVTAEVNGVDAGNGIYGQEDRVTSFSVGDAVLMKIDVAAHRMRVLRNGTLERTIPISAGKPGFTTRSGIKVIIEKFRTKTMDALTTGISEDDPEYYNIEDVEYAQRVTYSGEFLHAAPWSVGSQGSANVSHGCVGMSTENAAWLYGLTRRGDVVDVTGTDRGMEPTNGYGDWNLSWAAYQAGSALSPR